MEAKEISEWIWNNKKIFQALEITKRWLTNIIETRASIKELIHQLLEISDWELSRLPYIIMDYLKENSFSTSTQKVIEYKTTEDFTLLVRYIEETWCDYLLKNKYNALHHLLLLNNLKLYKK